MVNVLLVIVATTFAMDNVLLAPHVAPVIINQILVLDQLILSARNAAPTVSHAVLPLATPASLAIISMVVAAQRAVFARVHNINNMDAVLVLTPFVKAVQLLPLIVRHVPAIAVTHVRPDTLSTIEAYV